MSLGSFRCTSASRSISGIKLQPLRRGWQRKALVVPSFSKLTYLLQVVLLKAGPYASHIGVIIEIIDHNRTIGDGPTTGRSVLEPVTPFPHHIMMSYSTSTNN
ncbi:hypothetical protein F5148DRAFT_371300 [Russula earlei]|uniref:Uncharacterized protein n=1 Tax=Russula earlei TaxID=71964 RepID=A0ACC0U266_9AGAM|nr:hypothetical protein F5148DRAFT_371300 [Russula earlei]